MRCSLGRPPYYAIFDAILGPDGASRRSRPQTVSGARRRRADRAPESGDDGAQRPMLGIARPGRVLGMDPIVNESELPDHRRGEDEGIEIGLAHAAVDR